MTQATGEPGSTTRRNPALAVRVRVVYGVLGVVCIALLGAGAAFSTQPWAAACLGAGLVSAAVVGVSAALRSLTTATFGVGLVLAAGLIVAGGLTGEAVLVGSGVLGLTVVGAGAAITFAILDRPEAGGRGTTSGGITAILEEIHSHSMLSDHAKRVLFRERELGLLRDAMETDIAQGKYHAALALCDEMANAFGYREEAEVFRERIEQAGREHYEHDVTSAVASLDALLAARDWPAVHDEAARIRRLYGDSHLVQDLDARILQARDEHKAELEHQFLDAARRDDVTSAMELLRQLDRYLSAEEAERLTEVAEGVVVRHRENLGVQFKLAVSDHRWAEAAQIGEFIVAEFPNTKMADEVRSMIDVLRTRATRAATQV